MARPGRAWVFKTLSLTASKITEPYAPMLMLRHHDKTWLFHRIADQFRPGRNRHGDVPRDQQDQPHPRQAQSRSKRGVSTVGFGVFSPLRSSPLAGSIEECSTVEFFRVRARPGRVGTVSVWARPGWVGTLTTSVKVPPSGQGGTSNRVAGKSTANY